MNWANARETKCESVEAVVAAAMERSEKMNWANTYKWALILTPYKCIYVVFKT